MYINNKLSKAVRLAIAFGAVSATVFTAAVSAQEEGADTKVERIEVTGSRIKRADLESASPVSIISSANIESLGITNVADVLQMSTAQLGGLTGAVNNGGRGNATASLRSLGANRTLVLLNGRRVVAGGTGAGSSVDLNTIPVAMVERVEVLKDGASAVYGSDAVAGVINIITKRDFEGAELSLQYGQSTKHDGEQVDMNLTVGHSSSKGNIMFNLGYSDRGEVGQGDRGFSACPISDAGGTVGKACTLSGQTVMNRLQNPAFGNIVTTDWVDGKPVGAGYETYNSAVHGYNYSVDSFNMTGSRRYNFSTVGTYEIQDDLRLFGELTYNKRLSDQKMAAQPLNSTIGFLVPVDPDVYAFAGAYDWAEQFRGTGTTIAGNRRMNDVGQRSYSQEIDTSRIVLGVEGILPNDWEWSAYWNWGRNTAKDVVTNYMNMDRVMRSMNQNCVGVAYDPATGTVTGNNPDAPCINYFGSNNLSADDIAYISYTDQSTGFNQQETVALSLSGDLFELPAGFVGFAFGVEHREEKGGENPDSLTAAGLGSGNASTPTAGGYSVKEAYLELAIPLLRDLPGVSALDLEAAVRYFDYSTFGDDSTWKLGLSWRVADSFMVRSVLSTAFRAPSISELYSGQYTSYEGYTDPCNAYPSVENADYAVACARDAAAGLIGVAHEQSNSQVRALLGGNPDLTPETADTFTLGIVTEPIDGLSITVDYFRTKMDNVITSFAPDTIFDRCYREGANGGVGGSSTWCSSIKRDQFGDFLLPESFNRNSASREVEGVDYNVRYRTDAAGLAWVLDWEATQMLTWESKPFEGAEVLDYVGVAVGKAGIPKWKHKFGLDVMSDNWTVNYTIQVIGDMLDQDVAWADNPDAVLATGRDYKSESVVYHHASFKYSFDSNLSLSVGIQNLFDKTPPFFAGAFNRGDANTDQYVYDVVGRRWYARLNYQF